LTFLHSVIEIKKVFLPKRFQINKYQDYRKAVGVKNVFYFYEKPVYDDEREISFHQLHSKPMCAR